MSYYLQLAFVRGVCDFCDDRDDWLDHLCFGSGCRISCDDFDPWVFHFDVSILMELTTLSTWLFLRN